MTRDALLRRCTADLLAGREWTVLLAEHLPLEARQYTSVLLLGEESTRVASMLGARVAERRYLYGAKRIQPLGMEDHGFYSLLEFIKRAGIHVCHIRHNFKTQAVLSLGALLLTLQD